MSRSIIGYKLVDSKTGDVLKEYKASQGRTARNRADKLDNEYGSYRYKACPIFSECEDSKNLIEGGC